MRLVGIFSIFADISLIFMKKRIFLVFAFLTAVCVFTAFGDDNRQPIGNEWIDPGFANVLQKRGYIKDAITVTPADVADITEFNVSDSQLTSLRGIEYFVSLKELDCSSNQLRAIDVSGNPQLAILKCSDNQLTGLDVSKNPQLMYFECGDNQLTELDVSNNPKMEIFTFWGNPGANGLFRVKAWFDNSNVPSSITSLGDYESSWEYDGEMVRVDYYK